MDKGNDSRREEVLRSYLDLTQEQVRQQLADILAREATAPGHRQVPFNAVETLLCYGLFYLLDPHRYGGGNHDDGVTEESRYIIKKIDLDYFGDAE
jgi:alkylation response protein AidB-like acyl-CoA dehydrogenase